MKKLGKVEMAKRIFADRVRAGLRQEQRERYLIELNEVLPDLEREFDQAVLKGFLPAPLDMKALLGKKTLDAKAR